MSVRKRIGLLIISVGVVSALYLVYQITTKIRSKKKIAGEISHLEGLRLFTLDSALHEQTFLHNNKRTLVVLFNSECDHCRSELDELDKNIDLFRTANVLIISAEPIRTIKTFLANYGFPKEANTYVCKMNAGDVLSSFGTISFPHLIVYDRDNSLIKTFSGETSIAEISKYLRL
jgi:thiol-disulfide isomerase/thioredoxin